MNKVGVLWLVGAGPGDPELITLKAVRVLQQADVVMYDALVNEALLQHVKQDAIIQYVGKRLGQHSHTQEAINQLIVEYGRKYSAIVRLKGGDPFVFGRAQEEIAAARAVGMQVQMVPGISSALAVPALQGIPATSRGITDSFWVSTGTTASGQLPDDLPLAAQSRATVIILMGTQQLSVIARLFMQYRKSNTPVAIIQNGSLPKQVFITGTLADIEEKAIVAAIGNPAVLVIGEVVALGW
jgi:uroporphyrin-III C-methyltransferase